MKMIQKLRSNRGETMVEMLVSMLILTLSICLLVTMIAVSYQFDRQARELDKAYKQDLAAAENFTDGFSTSGTIKLKLNGVGASGGEQTINVKIYSNADSDLKSYKLP